MNAYNIFLRKMQDMEYKSKNPELQTWKQKFVPLTKFNIPKPFIEKYSKRKNNSDYQHKLLIKLGLMKKEQKMPKIENLEQKFSKEIYGKWDVVEGAKLAYKVVR